MPCAVRTKSIGYDSCGVQNWTDCGNDVFSGFHPRLERSQFPLSLERVADGAGIDAGDGRSEEHTSELQSRPHLVCRLLLEKKKRTDLCRTDIFEKSFDLDDQFAPVYTDLVGTGLEF